MGLDILVTQRTAAEGKMALNFYVNTGAQLTFELTKDSIGDLHLMLDKEQCVKLIALIGHDIFVNDR